jgi:hypothetical protein
MKKRKEEISAKNYAVFVVSIKDKLKKRKRKNDLDFPNLHILVTKKEKLDEALEATTKTKQKEILNLKKRFKGIVESEGISYYPTKVEAYKAAYNRLNSLLKEKRKARIHRDSPTDNYSVYCIRLNPEAWEDKTFRDANLDLVSNDLNKEPATIRGYYVGQTGKVIMERYQQHMSQDLKTSTKWGKKYFMEPFTEAFDSKIIKDFEKETGKATTGLPYGKSIIVEQELTDWIRKKGMGAYCA